MTVPLRGFNAIYTVLDLVRDAIVDELSSVNQQMARVSVVPGAIAWDNCDQCGLLALAAQRFFLTDLFPVEQTTTEFKQGAFLGADLVVQAIRCAPQPQGSDLAPSVEALDTTARLVLNDAYAVLCATTTELQTLVDTMKIEDYMVRQQVFLGPEGACVGSELQFVVALDR